MLSSASDAARLAFFAVAGLITSALSLALVFAIAMATEDFNLLGLYVIFIVPAGALLVGAIAGCGFALAAWLTGLRFSVRVFALGCTILSLAYLGAHWVDYQSVAHLWHAGFLSYFDYATQSMTFAIGSGTPFNVGAFGYLFRFLELAGFVGGGLGIQYALSRRPYCDESGRYMRKLRTISVPFGLPAPPETLAAPDSPPANLPDQEVPVDDDDSIGSAPAPAEPESIDGTGWRTDALLAAHHAEDAENFSRWWGELAASNGLNGKLFPRVTMVLWHCPVSGNGHLDATFQAAADNAESIANVPVPKALIRAVGGGPAPSAGPPAA